MAMTKHPDPEKVKPAEHRADVKVETPVAPVAVSPVVAKALAKDGRDVLAVPQTPDVHGAPAAVGKVGPGDAVVVQECLNALAKVTDEGSLQAILAAVQGRVGVPEKIEPKQSGHTV